MPGSVGQQRHIQRVGDLGRGEDNDDIDDNSDDGGENGG